MEGRTNSPDTFITCIPNIESIFGYARNQNEQRENTMLLKANKKLAFPLIVGILIFSMLQIGLLNVQAATSFHYEKATYNGHAGYITEWRIAGDLDKPIIVVLGFDPDNSFTVDDAITMYDTLITDMNSKGYDVIIFDYYDGDLWIEQNAENLADFIRYLDTWFSGDYPLAVVGASMGGIVSRVMFAQENSNMGVDMFLTLDSPHYGVYFSNYIDVLAGIIVDFFTLTPAGQQMYHGSELYNELYGWLRSVETNTFLTNVIGPMTTAAFAMSNGEGYWAVTWDDLVVHTKYHPVTSYTMISNNAVDFIPYHSAMNLDDPSTDYFVWFGKTYYWYKSTQTSYFDYKFPTYRQEHSASNFGYLLELAMQFIQDYWPQ